MTSSKHSSTWNPSSTDDTGPESCTQCGGPLAWRQAHPYPVGWQLAFAVSAVAFWILFEKIRDNRTVIWSWCVLQAILGVPLIRGRIRSRKRILRCVRCTAAVR